MYYSMELNFHSFSYIKEPNKNIWFKNVKLKSVETRAFKLFKLSTKTNKIIAMFWQLYIIVKKVVI